MNTRLITFFGFVVVSIFSCSIGESTKYSKPNYIEKILESEIYTRNQLDLYGNVRSILEYDLKGLDTSEVPATEINAVPKYIEISADTLITKIFARSIESSFSVLFNKSGNSLKKVYWFTHQGQADTRSTNFYEYNANEQLEKKIEYQQLGNGIKGLGELRRESEYVYDKSNRLIYRCIEENNESEPSKMCSKILYENRDILIENLIFNPQTGDTTKITNNIVSSNDVIIVNPKIEIREINENGDLIKLEIMDHGSHNVEYHIIYSYDYDGNMTTKTDFDEMNRIVSLENYIYDDRILIAKTENYQDGFKREYYSNTNKLLELQSMDNRDSITTHLQEFRKYDTLDNLMSFTSKYKYSVYPEELRSHEYKYKFDSQNNWIEKRSYVDGLLTEIVKREILYY